MEKINSKKMLSDVQPEKSFWVSNGPIIRNLKEAAAVIRKLSPEQFVHHVNHEKNDFAKWFEEVIGDKILAQRVRMMKTKDAIAKTVAQRIVALHKLAP